MRAGAWLVLLVACGGRTGLGIGSGQAGDGGGGDGQVCHAEIIATDSQGATALALDGDAVFWGTTDGLVEKHDATGNSVLVTEPVAIASVALDAAHVYYTTDAGVLRAVPRAGGAAVDIATQLGQPFALTLDPVSGSFYVLDHGAGIAAGRVLRVEPAGTVTEMFTGLDVPSGLTIDDVNVYFAAHDALVGGQLVNGPLISIPKAGGLGVMLAQGLHQSSSIALADAASSDLYYIEQLDAQLTEHGGLRRIPKMGGDVVAVASTPGVLPLDVFVDASGAYVTTFSGQTNQDQGALLRFATDGSATSELAATPGVVYGYVRASSTSIYWTINWRAGHPPADGASVRKLCK